MYFKVGVYIREIINRQSDPSNYTKIALSTIMVTIMVEAGQKLNFNFTPVNEAIQALVNFKKKVIDSKLQIKDPMQYNAKLKIDIELV